jgi:hypothetical protein
MSNYNNTKWSIGRVLCPIWNAVGRVNNFVYSLYEEPPWIYLLSSIEPVTFLAFGILLSFSSSSNSILYFD